MLQNLTEQQVIEIVERALDSHRDPKGYVDDVMGEIIDNQPVLYDYIRNCGLKSFRIDNPIIYALGVCVMYELLPEDEKELEILEDVLLLSRGRFMERTSTNEIDMNWLLDFIEENYPVFANWLGGELSTLDSHEDKAAFFLGVSAVLIPFLIRSELDGKLIDYRKLPIDLRFANLL